MTGTITYTLPGLVSRDSSQPLVASGANPNAEINFPIAPPESWFQKQTYNRPQKVKITPEGRIYGHVAVFGVDHIGYDGVSRQAPRSSTDYQWYKQGEVITAEGTTVETGVITAALKHADTDVYDAVKASKHYDDTTYGLADVVAYDDDIGVQIAGALRPDVTLAQARALRASNFSPDWRPVKQKGRFMKKLEMVAIMACNLSGFIINPLVASGNIDAEQANDSLITPGDTCIKLDDEGNVVFMCGTAWGVKDEDDDESLASTVAALSDRVEFLETSLRRVLSQELLAEAFGQVNQQDNQQDS